MAASDSMKQIFDEEGKFVWNVTDYNGRLYASFRGDMVERIERYKQEKSFPVREDDVYLFTYPKSGTHWMMEILTMLLTGSVDQPAELGWQMLESSYDWKTPFPHGPRRRIISSHMHCDDIPHDIFNNTSGKIVQVLRNPADVAVSLYDHLSKEVKGIALSYGWDDFITKLYCDKQRMVSATWFNYTSTWWTRCSKNPNYLPVFFEELKEAPLKVIGEIAIFLGVDVHKNLLEQIVDRTSFHKLKEAKEGKEGPGLRGNFVEGFSMYRKGVVGDWRSHFTKEQHQHLMTHFNQELQEFPELHQRFSPYLEM